MKLKQRPNDFQVRERLRPEVITAKGSHRVYRVRKRKLTSLEAAAELAHAAGTVAGEVAMAGLKDRQGVTEQFMSLPRGRSVYIDSQELRVKPEGFAAHPISADDSLGNEFEITVRGLGRSDATLLERQVPWVARHGLPNYFDEQRFGNLTYGQGWIARDLVEGQVERALRRLLTSTSTATPERERRFRTALRRQWGDWRACRDIAGKLGAHHSVFEHLGRDPDDFRGAFSRVSLRLRLIHLYAFQSHLWNRAVVRDLRWAAKRRRLLSVSGVEGPLVFFAEEPPESWLPQSNFRLPGPGLEGVTDPGQRRAYELVLERERLRPEDLRIDGIGGFQLKAEDRPLLLLPSELEVTSVKPDSLNPGSRAVTLCFALDRGAYASLVIKRLLARAGGRQPGHNRAQAPQGEKEGSGRDGARPSGYAARPAARGAEPGPGRRSRESTGTSFGTNRAGGDRPDTNRRNRSSASRTKSAKRKRGGSE